jgi:vancomycin resistance protein YoaR
MHNVFVAAVMSATLLLSRQPTIVSPVAGGAGELGAAQQETLSEGVLDLSTRNPSEAINQGFKENILVNLDYLYKDRARIIIRPGEVFAFHKNIHPDFRGSVIVTQESEYKASEGYKLIAGLYGNGVCHLATLMNYAASQAGLEVTAMVSHDFAPVPGIDRKYGTSIKFSPNIGGTSERQNLYIKNTKDYPVEFKFSQQGDVLKFAVVKS